MSNLNPTGLGDDFLSGARRPFRPMYWGLRWMAVVCVVALAIGGLHLITPAQPERTSDTTQDSVAQGIADSAAAAFTDSAVGADPKMTAAERAAGLPRDPVAGLTAMTPIGPVQMVLPQGLGNARRTNSGQVVYPDAGAGFDFLAENTSTGARTVARIDDPLGVRAVTTFLRTPANTVMLAHTNGYLTINKATPSAETIGMFSPSEARDANGALVASAYVVRQWAQGLYQLSEVIAPTATTAWPVFVDPPMNVLGLGGTPLPEFGFSSITSAIAGAADAVSSAAVTAASATVSGVSAAANFVKENPLESAMLVGGVALSLTGVGGPAGGMMIAAAAVNVSSSVLDVVAAHNPDNVLLGEVSVAMGVVSMVTPQGAGKRVIEEVVEEGVDQAVTQVARHADEFVIDVAESTPTPPAQLVDDIAEAAGPGVAPKSPNAPPAGGVYVVYDRQGTPVYVGRSIDVERRLATHANQGVKLRPGESVQIYRTDDLNTQRGVEQILMDQNGTLRTQSNPDGRNLIRGVAESNPNRSTYNQAGQDYLNGRDAPQISERPSSPAQQRSNQSAQAVAAADQQRDSAQQSARDNQSGSQRNNESGSNGNHSSSDNKKDKKSKLHHPRPTG